MNKLVAACLAAFSLALPPAAAQSLPDEIATPYVAYTEAMENGASEAALSHARAAWDAAENLSFDRQTTAILADNYAKLALRTRDHDNAARAFVRTAELLEAAGSDSAAQVRSLALAAHASLSGGDFEAARQHADRAGDLVESATDIVGEERGRLIFNSRSIHAAAEWSDGRVRPAFVRAREAIEAADGIDVTNAPYYGIVTFVLGAAHSLNYDRLEAAYWLTVAYHYRPQERTAIYWWSNYARSQLDEEQREELLERLANTSLPEVEDNVTQAEWEAREDRNTLLAAEGFVDAVPVRREAPEYAYDARAAGFEGIAVLAYTVRADGRVADPEVLISVPVRDFGEAGLRAIRSWRFDPATLDGEAVDRPDKIVEFRFVMGDE